MSREDEIREQVKGIREVWNAGYKVGYSEQLDLVQHIDYLLRENQRLREAMKLLRRRIDDPAWTVNELQAFIATALQPEDGE